MDLRARLDSLLRRQRLFLRAGGARNSRRGIDAVSRVGDRKSLAQKKPSRGSIRDGLLFFRQPGRR